MELWGRARKGLTQRRAVPERNLYQLRMVLRLGDQAARPRHGPFTTSGANRVPGMAEAPAFCFVTAVLGQGGKPADRPSSLLKKEKRLSS